MAKVAKINEALPWSLFSAGGVMAALFLPAIILSTGYLLPTDDAATAAERYEQLRFIWGGLWWHWLIRIVLFFVISLSFFHCAHRIKHTVVELGLHGLGLALPIACYGGAIVGTLFTAWIVFTI